MNFKRRAAALASTTLLVLVTTTGAEAGPSQVHQPTWDAMTVAHVNTIQVGKMWNTCDMWKHNREEFIQKTSQLIHDEPAYGFYGERITIQRYMYQNGGC